MGLSYGGSLLLPRSWLAHLGISGFNTQRAAHAVGIYDLSHTLHNISVQLCRHFSSDHLLRTKLVVQVSKCLRGCDVSITNTSLNAALRKDFTPELLIYTSTCTGGVILATFTEKLARPSGDSTLF